MARRRAVGHGIKRFPSVLEIAHNRIGGEVKALHIHLERFAASLDDRSARFAYLLAISAAHEATLILNNGVPRREAFAQVEAEFEASKAEWQEMSDGVGFYADVQDAPQSVMAEASSDLCEACNDVFCLCERKAA